jgi:hypothetical protein
LKENIISQEELQEFDKKIREQISKFNISSFKNPIIIENLGGATCTNRIKTFVNKFLNILSEYTSFHTKYHFLLTTKDIETLELFSTNSNVKLKTHINSIKNINIELPLLNPIHFINTLDFKPDLVFIFNMSKNKECLNDSVELRDDFLNISPKCVWVLPEDYVSELANLDPHMPVKKNYVEINIDPPGDKIDDFQRALTLATKAHKNQFRKGTTTPYIVHPVMVSMILREEKLPEHLLLSALLHDTIEDSQVTYKDIETKFGKDVAKIVSHLSDKDKSLTWNVRKQHEINFLKRRATSEELIIACADKYHNISCIASDYKTSGMNIWERFNAPKDRQKWYYKELVKVFKERDNFPKNFTIYEKFRNKVQEVFPE